MFSYHDVRIMPLQPEPELQPESKPCSTPDDGATNAQDEDDEALFRLPSRNTLRNERIAALEKRAAA